MVVLLPSHTVAHSPGCDTNAWVTRNNDTGMGKCVSKFQASPAINELQTLLISNFTQISATLPNSFEGSMLSLVKNQAIPRGLAF